MINEIERLEDENKAAKKSIEHLESTINTLVEENKLDKKSLEIATSAIDILRNVSDEAVSKAYKFMEENLNPALARMFPNTKRRIHIKEYTRGNQYPQLEFELHVGNGVTRSLKSDSGHGLAQIVSLLSILYLIVITGSRRILVMDEVMSGLSVRNRLIVTDILWSFTEIGFQFIINEHGYIPKGSKVYHFEMVGDVSHIKNEYIADTGVYLQGDDSGDYGYTNEDNARTMYEEEEEIESENTSSTNKDVGGIVSI